MIILKRALAVLGITFGMAGGFCFIGRLVANKDIETEKKSFADDCRKYVLEASMPDISLTDDDVIKMAAQKAKEEGIKWVQVKLDNIESKEEQSEQMERVGRSALGVSVVANAVSLIVGRSKE